MPIHHLRRILPPHWRRRLHFLTRRIPPHWLYLWNDRRLDWFTGVAPDMRDRACLVTYDLQPGCFLEAYWVDRVGASGT